ncbi:hypothetical protein [Bradyrhizobium sp.]|uniref:hypothetical protein n=1 Tax=Bradyrhizobium sp. TaxID=376 RepID=UPI0025C4B9EC|nr:hypothetical protein [Bradyrhizobium sp.]
MLSLAQLLSTDPAAWIRTRLRVVHFCGLVLGVGAATLLDLIIARVVLVRGISREHVHVIDFAVFFRDRKQTGSAAWEIKAACADGTTRWESTARLAISGNKLKWSGKRGSETYVRCAGDLAGNLARSAQLR